MGGSGSTERLRERSELACERDKDGMGGDARRERARAAPFVANLGTAWSLCVWMLPQLVLMIISISQLILIKVIITWVVTIWI